MYKIQLPTRSYVSEVCVFGIKDLLRPKLIELFLLFLPVAKNCNEIYGLTRYISSGCNLSNQMMLMLLFWSLWQKGKSKWENDKHAWLDNPARSLAVSTKYEKKPTSQNLNIHKTSRDKRILLAVNHNKQQCVPSFSSGQAWEQKARSKMKLYLYKNICQGRPQNAIADLYLKIKLRWFMCSIQI